MRLRDHPEIDWPPRGWVSSSKNPPPLARTSILTKVFKSIARDNKPDGIVLQTQEKNDLWHMTYRMDDLAHLENLFTVLNGSVGKSMEEIGDLEIDAHFNLM
jgi:hypothetical protein